MKSDDTNHSRLRVLAIALSFLLFSNILYASKKVDNVSYETINICTLSQDILRDQVLISMEVTYSNPQEDKKIAIKAIHIELDKLNKKRVKKRLHKDIAKLKNYWSKTEKKLEKTIEDKSAKSLYLEVSSFSKACLIIADKVDNKNKDSFKNRVSKLNFYVHKLTTIYMIKSWNAIDEKIYKKEVKQMLRSYQELYKSLIDTKNLTKVTKSQLEEINKLFVTFKFMTTSNSGRYMPTLAAKKALSINAITLKILEGK